MFYRIILGFACSLAAIPAISAQPKFVILTPDAATNQRIAGKPISDLDLIVYDEGPEGLTIDPVMPAHWRWLAGKGSTSSGARVEFVVWEGHVYANSVEVSAFRSRKYPDLFTDRIQSNAFHMGMRKHDEALIFVATMDAKDIRLRIDSSVFGEEKRLDFHLGKGEGTLIRIFPMQPPYRP